MTPRRGRDRGSLALEHSGPQPQGRDGNPQPKRVSQVSPGGHPPQRASGRPFGRSPSQWIAQNYAVREKYILDISHRLGVQPEIDVFASRSNRRCARWWGPGSREATDAFTASWGEGVLWLNPPYSRLPDVIKKCRADGAHALLAAPTWAKKRWFQEANKLAVKKIIYPRETRFFERDGQPCRAAPWPITVFLLCGHQHRCRPADLTKFPAGVRFGLRLAEPPPGTRGALGAEGVRTAHLGLVSALKASPTPGPAPRPEEGSRPKMLDLFCGTGSVGRAYKKLGFDVWTVDNDPRWTPDILVDVLEWDYKRDLRPGEFEVVAAGVPCTEYSRALTTRKRNLEGADRLVQRTLEIIRYLNPPRWWMENPRHGLLPKRTFMEGIPFADVDYCQYSDWGYQKPTRIWGSPHVLAFGARKCDGKNCANLAVESCGWRRGRHRIQLSGPTQNLPRHLKYRVPVSLVLDIAQAPLPPEFSGGPSAALPVTALASSAQAGMPKAGPTTQSFAAASDLQPSPASATPAQATLLPSRHDDQADAPSPSSLQSRYLQHPGGHNCHRAQGGAPRGHRFANQPGPVPSGIYTPASQA